MSIITITPTDAFKILTEDKNSLLVDVRSFEEANFIGLVNPSEIDDRVAILPWKTFPSMKINPKFSDTLEELLSKAFSENSKDAKILFLCRSGARSEQAAEQFATLGYACYNIENGFEGDIDENGHRGKLNGWKANNLPWRQS